MIKRLIIIFMSMIPVFVNAQSFDDLWKEYSTAEKKDLPKTCLQVLEKIVAKAEKEKAYPQLLKAELQTVEITQNLAPDSIETLKSELMDRATMLETTDKVAAAVLNLALYEGARAFDIADAKPYLDKAFADKDILAATKAENWKDIISVKSGSEVFGGDMLSLMGYAVQQYQMLYDYYKSKGNRRACALIGQNIFSADLVEEYKDLPEGAYLAKKYLDDKTHGFYRFDDETYALLQEYRKHWSGTPQAELFENIQKENMSGSLIVDDFPELVPINKKTTVEISTRNISRVKMVIVPLTVSGGEVPYNNGTLSKKQYQDFLGKYAKKSGSGYKGEIIIEKDLEIKNSYTETKDSLLIPALPSGVYYVKVSTDYKDTEGNGYKLNNNLTALACQGLMCVSNLRILSLKLSNDNDANKENSKTVVVDAITGHEQKDAKIEKKNNGRWIRAYTKTDNGLPYRTEPWTGYYHYEPADCDEICNLFTDRPIYRPGQTISVAGILHKVVKGTKTEVVANKQMTLTLYDANYKSVASKTVVTDDFGTVAAEFQIPQGMLTGRWHIQGENNSVFFRVEEYKRPTFEVGFKQYDGEYKLGDTIKVTGYAKTYSGVPVANAKVAYTVNRCLPWWGWWRNNDVSDDSVVEDSVVTDDNGEFTVMVPLVVSELDKKNMHSCIVGYRYSIKATVTNLAEESHEGEYSIYASNKSVLLNVTINEKFQKGTDSGLAVKVINSSGVELKGVKVQLKIDGKEYSDADAAKAGMAKLASGKHSIIATLKDNPLLKADEEVTDTATFVIFSLDDKTPVEKTNMWTYITASQFKDEKDVVSLQFGSSLKDVEVFYDVFEGKSHKESSVLRCSNSLIRKDFKYNGENILVTIMWMKDDVLYKKSFSIARPLPQKKLDVTWKTFRNKLLPGQKEEWTLCVKKPKAKAAKAQVLACLYDKSLDAIASREWYMNLGMTTGNITAGWGYNKADDLSLHIGYAFVKGKEPSLNLSEFNIWPFKYSSRFTDTRVYSLSSMAYGKAPAAVYDSVEESADMEISSEMPKTASAKQMRIRGIANNAADSGAGDVEAKTVQMRSNFSETAFFYPQLVADENGEVTVKFTLPESTTTWNFRALAHDREMNNGILTDEIVAQKQLMINPNMPRFLRQGDKAVLASVISNLSDKNLDAKAILQIVDPQTEKVLLENTKDVCVAAGKTAVVDFDFDTAADLQSANLNFLIVKVYVEADDYSDGEQHYLALLDNEEPVMTTKVITMVKPGKEIVNTNELFPADAKEKKLTVEWTENPVWLMFETLPYMQSQDMTNIFSQAAAYYANSLGCFMIKSLPSSVSNILQEASKMEVSALEKNEELNTLLLRETPWAVDASGETERIRLLKNFYDENKLQYNQTQLIDKLKKEQCQNGGWSWCPGMSVSYHITSQICELLVRLDNMIGKQNAHSAMLEKAMNCLQKKAHEEILEMKKDERAGRPIYIYDCYALQYVYLKALSGKTLTKSDRSDADFLISYLKKQERKNSLYMKAKLAIVLYYMGEKKLAKEYVKSIKEYSVYKELEGRYFDTRRAEYSWQDYKQPTQTMTIEALKMVTPDDKQTVVEMQRWLLMQKRTQMWDTPINTVNNIYAFATSACKSDNETLPLEDMNLSSSKGYSKTIYNDGDIKEQYVFEKNDDNVSWGAVYAQFKQAASAVNDYSQGLSISREVKVTGNKAKVVITIVADRDYDFVQVVDKRAASLEPVSQVSRYRRTNGSEYYEAPQDSRTCYYLDVMRKGKHTIETEYYVDRKGDYHSGTCTVQCTYSPEYYGRTGGK